MYNSFEQDIPDDPIQRVRAMARDLAYGAAQGLWSSGFMLIHYGATPEPDWIDAGGPGDFTSLLDKWRSVMPHIGLLVSFGYLQEQQRENRESIYTLTSRAFELLEQAPITKVFISYRRAESSALSLLVLARFKLALGLEPFLDMNIEPGEEWHAELKDRISTCEHFVSLIGPTTLDSEHVREELRWALGSGVRITPVWHNGFGDSHVARMRRSYPELEPFLEKQAIRVEAENPAAYESAIIQLLNRFGYTP
jgi:hypothetical protein